MRRVSLFLSLAAAATVASTASAQVRSVARADAAVEAPRGATLGDPNRRICKDLHATGSRLAKAKVCKTAREWADQQVTHQENAERLQRTRTPDVE